MASRFGLKKSKNGKFVFNLLADSGKVIWTRELYGTKASALNGMESVKQNASDDGRYGRLSAKDGSPYYTLRAGNGQIIGQSQMFSGEKARGEGIESVKTNAPRGGGRRPDCVTRLCRLCNGPAGVGLCCAWVCAPCAAQGRAARLKCPHVLTPPLCRAPARVHPATH
jgi:hypothetical protein